tara:strand:- start:271 stop:528 length:258 start_codon:yes stop_codon:yes gene_type:complete
MKEKKAKQGQKQAEVAGRAAQASATDAAKKAVTNDLDAPNGKRNFRDILSEGRARRMGASMRGVPDVSSMDERTKQILLQQLRPQ